MSKSPRWSVHPEEYVMPAASFDAVDYPPVAFRFAIRRTEDGSLLFRATDGRHAAALCRRLIESHKPVVAAAA